LLTGENAISYFLKCLKFETVLERI